MATRYRNRRDKDEHVLRLMAGIFMQRINSGLIKDALFCLPQWRTSRRLSWPCRIWARYEDNDARDVGWLYNKLMSELTDLGIKEEDLRLTLSTSMPDAGGGGPHDGRGLFGQRPRRQGHLARLRPGKSRRAAPAIALRRRGPSKNI